MRKVFVDTSGIIAFENVRDVDNTEAVRTLRVLQTSQPVRLVVYYTYETNPSDGWADPEVHNDPEPKRQEALKFGANIVVWALTN
jgi:hypothetical protein